jgi:hypothetical protein
MMRSKNNYHSPNYCGAPPVSGEIVFYGRTLRSYHILATRTPMEVCVRDVFALI